ncbi:hypothetical protein [Moraxella lacunata]|nr:hypothetical protein [Moraxella lacunata]
MKCVQIAKRLSYIAFGFFALGFLQNARANDVVELCETLQNSSENILTNRHLGDSYQDQSKRYSGLNSVKSYPFVQNYMKSILDRAYQKQIPKSPSQQLDQVIAFGEEIYKECLPKMQAFKAQLENQPKRVINVEGRGVCGLANSCLVKKITITPPNSTVQASSSGKYATLTTVSGGGIPAGNYGYTIYFDNKVCSGNVYLDGTKSNVQINVYSDSCNQSSVSAY